MTRRARCAFQWIYVVCKGQYHFFFSRACIGFKIKYFLMNEILSPLTFCILRILRFPSTSHKIPLFDTCTLYAGSEFKKNMILAFL